MRCILAIVLCYPFILCGQLITKEISNNTDHNSRTSATEADPVLTLPFWDDFSTSNSEPDPSKWKIGKNVFVNETIGNNPPTYKVATFDGQNSLGQAYTQEITFPGPADSLITHAIDLSQISTFNRNTVFLSFFWQAKGNGELPDEDDSLRVQFLAADSTWTTKWFQSGGLENSHDYFNQVILQVKDSKFFHSNFRIKFQAFINRGGLFDTWNIDYVYLNQGRNSSDTLHFDRALSGSGSLLFSPYYEIPSNQFFIDPAKYLTTQHMLAHNLDNSPHPLDYYYTLTNLTTGTVYVDTAMGNDGKGALQPLEYRTLNGPDLTPFALNNLDSQVIESRFYYKTGDKFLFEETDGNGDTLFLPVDLKVNDTISYRYTLYQHYAYDDGTAEFAAGINLLRGKVAVQFTIEEADTLTHLDIHIPDIIPNASGKSIDLIIWSKLSDNGMLRKQSYPIVISAKNQFNRIKLTTPVIVTDTFYVGYQQFTDNFIGIGFDRNNPEASSRIYYQTSNVWEQNDRISGALMIRPVFQNDAQYVLSTQLPKKEIKIYPNPTQGILHLDHHYEKLQIFNLTGSLLFNSNYQPSIDLSFLNNGVYVLKIEQGNQIHYQKIIIQH